MTEQIARYRNDIDGLRAIAILPVVFFHYGLEHPFSGGFVGVDIFFVISGFLITKHIHDEIQNGCFSILDFYNRRIRRIFPALFAVLLFCIVCSLTLEIPPEAKNTSQGIIGATLFVSNVIFYNMSGYFDVSSQNNPLLHTWSLSVEEQFYIVVPLFLYLMRKLSVDKLSLILCLALLISFVLCFFQVYHDPSAAFYLVQNRAWELLLGSVVAIGRFRIVTNKRTLELLGAAGALLIVGSTFILNKKSLFPGPGALAPCFGAALVLYSGARYETAVSRALSAGPLRFIGLVSYSFYLWHWPIWVFVSDYYTMSVFSTILLIGLVFGVSILSWHFIEKPFRTKPFRLSSKEVVSIAGAIMAGTLVLAFISAPLNSKIWHYDSAMNNILAYENIPITMRGGTCFLDPNKKGLQPLLTANCLEIKEKQQNYLIFGDSHAADLWYGLSQENPTINFLQASVGGCPPIIGAKSRIIGAKSSRGCAIFLNYMFNDFIPHHHLNGIILSARWEQDDVENALVTARRLRPYADRVIIFGPSPEYDKSLPKLLAR